LAKIDDSIPGDQDDLQGMKAVIKVWRQWKADALKTRDEHRASERRLRFLAVMPY
jgi:hypothetical protein